MQDKVVLVTGADGGLGKFVTQAFLDVGATVVGTSTKIQQSSFNNCSLHGDAGRISSLESAQSLVNQVTLASESWTFWLIPSVASRAVHPLPTQTTPPFRR